MTKRKKMMLFYIIVIFATLTMKNVSCQKLDLDIYKGCMDTKGCVGNTKNCVEEKNCSLLTTFFGETSDSYTIEIYGSVPQSNRYIAAGLSFDGNMDYDSVMACTVTSSLEVDVQMYWNSAKSGLYYSYPLGDIHFGLSNIQGQLVDDVLYCKFTRQSMLEIEIPSIEGETQVFDLNMDSYHLLLASGPLQ